MTPRRRPRASDSFPIMLSIDVQACPPIEVSPWRWTVAQEFVAGETLKERQTELALRMEQHHLGEDEFRTTLEGLICD